MNKITVTIRDDQKKWLDKHPSVNVSGLLQEAIDGIKREYRIIAHLRMEELKEESAGAP